MSSIDQYIPDTSSDSGVIDGYKAIYDTTANTILPSPLGLIELVIGLTTDGVIQIGAIFSIHSVTAKYRSIRRTPRLSRYHPNYSAILPMSKFCERASSLLAALAKLNLSPVA